MKEHTQANYDRLSRIYDLLAAGERRLQQAGLDKLAMQDGESGLEIGCGTGLSIVKTARCVGPRGHVSGIDISKKMAGIAWARCKKTGLNDRVSITRGDAVHLPYKPNSFDAIFISFTLELFEAQERRVILERCRDLLKSDGRICVVALANQVKASLVSRLYGWGRKTFPRLIDCQPIAVHAELAGAGYHVTEVVETAVWGLPVEIVVARQNPNL